MGVYISLVNFDQIFSNSLTHPIVVNDLSTVTRDERAYLEELIAQRFDGDPLSNEPSCECGQLKGGYNIGVTCNNCRSKVTEVFDKKLQPVIWLRAPKGVAGMINPMVMYQLKAKFTISGFDLISWLCNTDYQTTANKPVEIDKLEDMGIKRGYNNFVNNFDDYIEKMFSLKKTQVKKGVEDTLFTLIKMSRNEIFSQYIPIPNKAIMVIEDTPVGTYVDPIIVGAIDAIRTLSSIDTPFVNYTLRQKENRTAKALFMLCDFYSNLYKSVLSGKSGLFRKHVFGSRNCFSVRAVISSITQKHDYDEIYLHWSGAVTVFFIHLMSKMLRDGYSPNSAKEIIHNSTYTYNSYIHNLLNELISESPYKGIPCIFQRNPSLQRGSAQRLFITRVKTDPDDPTISLSILGVKGFNADFDGDEMNLTLTLDNDAAEDARHLAPHKSFLDINKTRGISDIASFPKPVVSTISNWLHYPRNEVVDINKKNFLDSISIN